MLLVQIAGGLFGVAVAYVIYRLVEMPYERSTAEAHIKYLAEMEEIRKKQQLLRNKT
jgi:hypothetical protein